MTDERRILGKSGEFSLNEAKVDDAILALLRLGLHAEHRAWKDLTGTAWKGCTKKGSYLTQ